MRRRHRADDDDEEDSEGEREGECTFGLADAFVVATFSFRRLRIICYALAGIFRALNRVSFRKFHISSVCLTLRHNV